MSMLPPELDANYELLEEPLHEGGMGAVYKARHRHLDERCVIKVMHSRLNDVSGARDRFVREAKRGKQLRHRNIAEVLTFFVGTDGKAYLVMEYVDGQNLRELLARQGPLSPQLVVTIGVQALAALGCLHAQQIVHRDISPDNLMLATDETGGPLVKMIDLGIAKSLDETMSLTATGMFVGKVQYASPEQFGESVDTRSDLYSLGVVLYELATGAKPNRATDTRAIIAESLRDEPPRPFSETDPNQRVPPSLRKVILKAIEKKPEKRFQTAVAFAEALQRALESDRTTAVDPIPETEPMHPRDIPTEPARPHSLVSAPPTVREPVAHFPRIALAAALLLAVIAFGAVRMLRTTEAAPHPPSATETTVTSGTAMTVTATQATMTVTPPAPTNPTQRQSAAEAIARGKQLAAERKIDAAYAAFAEATRANPDDAFAWANFGAAAALLERPDEARSAYERALSIDSSNWLAHYNFACLLTGSGARDEALRHLGAAIEQLRHQARSRDELAAMITSIRQDEALRSLRDDAEFTKLLAMD